MYATGEIRRPRQESASRPNPKDMHTIPAQQVKHLRRGEPMGGDSEC